VTPPGEWKGANKEDGVDQFWGEIISGVATGELGNWGRSPTLPKNQFWDSSKSGKKVGETEGKEGVQSTSTI